MDSWGPCEGVSMENAQDLARADPRSLFCQKETRPRRRTGGELIDYGVEVGVDGGGTVMNYLKK